MTQRLRPVAVGCRFWSISGLARHPVWSICLYMCADRSILLCSDVLLLYVANWALYKDLYYPESKTDISAYCTSCLSDI